MTNLDDLEDMLTSQKLGGEWKAPTRCIEWYCVPGDNYSHATTRESPMSNLDELEDVLNKIDPSDIIWGADAIGAVINRSKRQAFYMLQNNELPAKKIGGQYVASRQALLRFLLSEAG